MRKGQGRVDLRALQLPVAGNGVLTFVAGELSEEGAGVCRPSMVWVLVGT